MPARRPHVPALDGIRGAAVLAVLLYHGDHLTGGYLGVDLFFVLSGYLITTLLLGEQAGSGTVDLGRFWARRARRLLPALLAMLVAVGFWAHWGMADTAKGSLSGDALATVAYVANWRQIFGPTSYFAGFDDASPLRHTWSLAIEEQFYLLWPLVVLAVGALTPPAKRASRLLTVCLAGVAISAGAMIAASFAGVRTDRLYLGTDTRVAAILLGAALAALVATRPLHPSSTGRFALSMASITSVLLLAVAWVALSGDGDLLYRGGLLVCGIAATVVIADVTTDGPTIVRTLFEVAPLRWLGLVSYGLHLWHWPIYLILTPDATGLDGVALLAVRLLVSLGVAIASYLLIEQPVRTGRLPTALAAPSAAFGLAMVLLAVTVGSQGAVSPNEPGDGDGTALSADATSLLVVGDSVASYLTQEGIIPTRGELGVGVTDVSEVGCNLIATEGEIIGPGGDPEAWTHDCSNEWTKGLATDPEVVLALHGGFAYDPIEIDGERYDACDPEYRTIYQRATGAMLDELGSTGAQVVVASAPPATTERITDAFGEDEVVRRTTCLDDALREVLDDHPDVRYVDLAEWTCPDGACREEVDGTELRSDGIHFRGDGAIVAAAWLLPEILDR